MCGLVHVSEVGQGRDCVEWYREVSRDEIGRYLSRYYVMSVELRRSLRRGLGQRSHQNGGIIIDLRRWRGRNLRRREKENMVRLAREKKNNNRSVWQLFAMD